MIKIALISANFGQIDVWQPVPHQVTNEEFHLDIIQIDESNTPVPLPNLPNRLKGRYFKMQFHRIPEYEEYNYCIWIDGRVRIKSTYFVLDAVQAIKDDLLMIGKHPVRNCWEEEMQYVLDQIEKGHSYLKVRYGEQPIKAELDYYKNRLCIKPNTGLYASTIFIRRLTPKCKDSKVNRFFDYWWDLCLQWSWFDQPSLIAAIQIMDFPVKVWDYGELYDNKKYFDLVKHVKLQ